MKLMINQCKIIILCNDLRGILFPPLTSMNLTLRIKNYHQHTCSFCLCSCPSNKCFSMRNLPFEKRLNFLQKKGICYVLFRKGSDWKTM